MFLFQQHLHEGVGPGLKLGKGEIAAVHVVGVDGDGWDAELMGQGLPDVCLAQRDGHARLVLVENRAVYGEVAAGLQDHLLAPLDGQAGYERI